MKDLQIGRRGIDQFRATPNFQRFDDAQRPLDLDCGNNRRRDMVIGRSLMLKGDLVAVASGDLLSRRILRFAVTVGRAAAFCPAERIELLAGDAPATGKCREEQKGNTQTGEHFAHGCIQDNIRNTSSTE
jgi:hypothetical protein